jgi:cytochrome P450
MERVAIKTRRGDSWPDVPAHVPLELVHELDYLDPNTRVDPFSTTEHIFEELPPVFFNPIWAPALYKGAWVVTRYEDIREVYQNEQLYSTEGAAGFQKLMGETFRMIPLAVDPPEHAKYRLLLNPWFSPKAITAMEPRIRGVINELIDGFVDKGECDAAYDFARIYPVRVFLDLMGFPFSKFEDFLEWEYAILHSRGNAERMTWGVKSALAFLREFIEEVRKTPNDKLGSAIVHGQIDGKPMTQDDIIGTMFFLWVGGLDTVAATTSLMFRRLALQPDLQDQLRAHPELVPEAIEEFMRMQPLVNSNRLVKEDHEIHGVKIRKGDQIMAYNAAGNFDPAEFADPRTFKLDRPSNRHFTLAGGPHRCLGSHLARRELRIALSEFLRRVPPFRMKEGATMEVSPGLIAVPRLPIVWDPAT